MTRVECACEQELLELLVSGTWPDRADDDLRRHVEDCAHCQDLVAVVSPVRTAWADARLAAAPPASGMVWWRAQMRARQEAARAAARPVAVAEGIAVALALLAAVAATVIYTPHVASMLLAALTTTSGQTMTGLAAAALNPLNSVWLVTSLVAAGVLALTSLAIYVVSGGD